MKRFHVHISVADLQESIQFYSKLFGCGHRPVSSFDRGATLGLRAVQAGRYFHDVIGVCDEEHGQKCPLFPGITQRIYWSFPDPATFTGSPDEKLARVIEVREALQARIKSWLATLSGTVATPPTTTRN